MGAYAWQLQLHQRYFEDIERARASATGERESFSGFLQKFNFRSLSGYIGVNRRPAVPRWHRGVCQPVTDSLFQPRSRAEGRQPASASSVGSPKRRSSFLTAGAQITIKKRIIVRTRGTSITCNCLQSSVPTACLDPGTRIQPDSRAGKGSRM